MQHTFPRQEITLYFSAATIKEALNRYSAKMIIIACLSKNLALLSSAEYSICGKTVTYHLQITVTGVLEIRSSFVSLHDLFAFLNTIFRLRTTIKVKFNIHRKHIYIQLVFSPLFLLNKSDRVHI